MLGGRENIITAPKQSKPIYLPTYLAIHNYIYIYTYMFVCLFVCLSIHLFVFLSVYIYIHVYTIIHAYNCIYSAGQLVRTSFGSGEHVQKYNGYNVVRNEYLERHSIGMWDIYIYCMYIPISICIYSYIHIIIHTDSC